MINNIFTNRTPEEKFWSWFSKSSKRFHEMNDNDLPPFLGLINQKLFEINESLTCEFSQEIHNGIREFIISANGMIGFSSRIDVHPN